MNLAEKMKLYQSENHLYRNTPDEVYEDFVEMIRESTQELKKESLCESCDAKFDKILERIIGKELL